MWFRKSSRVEELERIIQMQSRLIHQLQSSLAMATGQSPPEPLPLPLKRPWPPSKVRGAEAVTVVDREVRREQELKAAVAASFPLPAYMANQKPVPEEQIPPGKSAGGGFSPSTNEPPPSLPAA